MDGCVDDLIFFLLLLDFQALKLRYVCNICTLWFLFWLCLREFLVMLIGSCSYLTYRESVVQYRCFKLSVRHLYQRPTCPSQITATCDILGILSETVVHVPWQEIYGRFGMQCTLLQLHTTVRYPCLCITHLGFSVSSGSQHIQLITIITQSLRHVVPDWCTVTCAATFRKPLHLTDASQFWLKPPAPNRVWAVDMLKGCPSSIRGPFPSDASTLDAHF